MLLEIDHHSGIPIYRQVMNQIRSQIMTSRLTAGARLESVRDLAARLNVNPMTVSKAYAFLEAEGLLERRRGIGLFIARIKPDKGRRIKNELLESVMDRAAMTAVQLGVSEKEALAFLKKCYKTYSSSKARQT